MIFTNQELGAILKMAIVMAGADGNVAEEEQALMAIELMRFGVKDKKTEIIGNEATNLTPTEACIIISKMTNEEKKYVTAYLGAMMCADGKIEESELKTWVLITKICGLPKMELQEAIEIMSNL